MADVIDLALVNVQKSCIACGATMRTSKDYTPCCILCREKGLYTKEDINADEARLEAAIETIASIVAERDAALARADREARALQRAHDALAPLEGDGLEGSDLAESISKVVAQRAELRRERNTERARAEAALATADRAGKGWVAEQARAEQAEERARVAELKLSRRAHFEMLAEET